MHKTWRILFMTEALGILNLSIFLYFAIGSGLDTAADAAGGGDTVDSSTAWLGVESSADFALESPS